MRHIFLLLCMLGKFLSDLRHYKFHLVGTVCIFVSINILELCPGMCFHCLKSVWSVQILLLGFFEWFHSHIEWGVHFPNSGGKILWSALPCVLYSVVSPLRLVGTGTIPGPSVNDSDALMTWPEHVLTHVLWSMFIWLGRPPSGSEVLSASFPVPSAAWAPWILGSLSSTQSDPPGTFPCQGLTTFRSSWGNRSLPLFIFRLRDHILHCPMSRI